MSWSSAWAINLLVVVPDVFLFIPENELTLYIYACDAFWALKVKAETTTSTNKNKV